MNSFIKKDKIIDLLKTNKKTLIPFASLGIATLFGTWFYASPYLTIQDMQQAASRKDEVELSKHIDYPTLKESFRAILQAKAQEEMTKQVQSGNPFAALGMATAQSMIDSLVNSIISPQMIGAALQGKTNTLQQQSAENKDQAQAPSPTSDQVVEMGYESLNTFAVQIKSVKTSQPSVELIFKRNGFDWKLTELRIPEPSTPTTAKDTNSNAISSPSPSSQIASGQKNGQTRTAAETSLDKGLLKATAGCDYELTKILLDKGANPNASIETFSFGQSEEIPLMTALTQTISASNHAVSSLSLFGELDRKDVQSYGTCLKVVKLLLDRKADPNIALNGINSASQSPLHAVIADEFINAELISLLLTKGANPNIKTNREWSLESFLGKGATPLMLLSQKKSVEEALHSKKPNNTGKYDSQKEVFFLIAKASDVNTQDDKGKTALMASANAGLEGITQELLKLGANSDLKDQKDKTALDYAIEKGNTQLIKLLTEKSKLGK